MTTEGPPLTDILAAFVAETPATDVPAATVEPAKNVILDTIGVALAAAGRPIGRIITEHVTQAPGTPATATVLGAGLKVSPEMAALANGTLANALDFDDGSHLSTHILPAALAVTEHRGLSGEGAARRFHRRARGGGAAHAGDRRQAAAAGRADPPRLVARRPGRPDRSRARGMPTARDWTAARPRPRSASRAAAQAVSAATWARWRRRCIPAMRRAPASRRPRWRGRGFTADTAILESPLGFLQAVVLPQDRDIAAVTERLGRPYVLEGPLRIKRFPACNPGHPLIDAALRLVHEQHVRADEIESIEADLHTFSLLRLDPWDEDSAGFSGAFLIAVTLIHGTFTLDQLTAEAVHDPRVTALMRRIRHVPAGDTETMTVALRGGRTVRTEVPPVRRLTQREPICEKFRTCAASVLTAQSIEILQEQILTLDTQPNVTRMMQAASDRR